MVSAPLTVDLGKDLGQRVDFLDDFDRLIRQKGYKVYWSRGILCPCRQNTQTDSPDPTCVACGGDGYFYVCPDDAPSPDLYAQEDPPFADLPDAKASQAVIQSVTKDPQIFEKFGEWIFGGAMVTTFSFTAIQYRDRLVIIDEVMTWQQTVKVPASRKIIVGRGDPREQLRYPARKVLGVFTVDPKTGATDHKDTIQLETDGSITLCDPKLPATDALVTVSYQYNPILILVDHVHGIRASPTKFKTKKKLGDSLTMPLQSMARLDFLVSPGTANGLGVVL